MTIDDDTMQVALRAPREAMEAIARRLVTDPVTVLALGHEIALGVTRAARSVPLRLRSNALAEIKDTAAAVYLLLTWRDHASPEVGRAIDSAERGCRARCRAALESIWASASRAEQRYLLTAFLVHRAYRDHWTGLGLIDPFTIPLNTASSFRRRYLPASSLAAVRTSLDDPRSRSMLLQGHDPRVRLVFGASLPPR